MVIYFIIYFVNGKQSDYAEVTYGILQGSVLGPTLLTLYTSDIPDTVDSGTVHMYMQTTPHFIASQKPSTK